ncbi:MAG: YhjD/YihY/BrkB family envelope integrity protein [Syntrophales bacterium]
MPGQILQKFRYPLHLKDMRLWMATLRDIISDAAKNYQINGDANQAAAISLYTILSAIPFFILTLWAAGIVFGSNPDMESELARMIQEIHPYFSGELLNQLGRIEQKKQVLGWVGMITLIWSSSLIFNCVETSFDLIFRTRESRNYFVSKLLAIAMIPMGWSVGLISVAFTYIATIVKRYPLVAEAGWLAMALVHGILFTYVIPYLVMVVFFTVIYKVIPVGKVTWGNALAGGAIFSALMEVAKHIFTWYVSNYTSYDVIYGSLQTVVILVIWVFYLALILLFCAELISSYQRRSLILIEKAFQRARKGELVRDERLFRKFGRVYRSGECIFKEGDRGREMYYILLGKVSVEKGSGQFKKILAEMGPGQYFGEIAALIDAPRTATVKAVTDSEIAVIDAAIFHNLLNRSEDVSYIMLQEFSRRIKNTNEKLEGLTRDWIRLISILYFFRKWPLGGHRDPVADLANYTGKDRVDIEMILKDLDERGVIRYEDGQVCEFHGDRVWSVLGGETTLPAA